MRKQEFIDALYEAGWTAPNDAQWGNISKLWAKIFPTVAKLEGELPDLIESAHQAGQYNAGVVPSSSEALKYRQYTLTD